MRKLASILFITLLILSAVSCKKDENTDTTAPVITLLGSNPCNHELGVPYTDAGATALDETDGDLTSEIEVINLVNPNVEGTYYVTYKVADHDGNKAADVVRTVNVMIF